MKPLTTERTHVFSSTTELSTVRSSQSSIWQGDVEALLESLPETTTFDLIVTSPPYNMRKSYERRLSRKAYVEWQSRVIARLVKHVKSTGSICWQVGNFVERGGIIPLDIEFAPIFEKNGLTLRNRIIWHFGHGLHSQRRFSGRYEVVLWYSRTDNYTFNLDAVRIPAKYPGKRHFKGPKLGQLSGNPLGKNPGDVWDIPNVKSNHVEKTAHPCQFPVGLVERLVLALSNVGDLVFDPFAGVGSTGVASVMHQRRFLGAEVNPEYVEVASARIDSALRGEQRYRPHDVPIFDHTTSKLSRISAE